MNIIHYKFLEKFVQKIELKRPETTLYYGNEFVGDFSYYSTDPA